ncbi:MAG TPA: amidase family protein, partial [Candidatus Acidoferrales bacterium]|nr:amidase family protein [Candidatus Acidoferrales bacterium]
MFRAKRIFVLLAVMLVAAQSGHSQTSRFHLQEATIDDVHRAIRNGQITCAGLVRLYLNRARAYNGVSNMLVTRDGAAIPDAPGVIRAGSPLKFPTETISISSLLPNFDQYAGPPIEFGRMEQTASDPTVQQQFGMTIGIPNAGQLNTLGTLNIRGERSVTCKGDRDRRPSDGPLPPGSPAVCEEFRKQPDALERAAELDTQYGRNPDLAKLPMYCIVFSFKDSYDTKDMRSTGGGDANYDIDFPSRDQTLVAQLRQKGAIIYAKTANTEYNGRPVPAIRGGEGTSRGINRPTKVFVSAQGYQRSTWAGNPSDAYDTTRAASLGSSSGSGVSVSSNLVTCSLCEETSMSCRGPSNHNGVALILPHKSLISFLGGAIGADIYLDRAGIMCRTVKDAAKVLDALKDPANGYYDP